MWHEIYQGFMSELTPQMWQMVYKSTYETVYMGLVSTAISVLVGYRLGLWRF